MVTLEGSGSIEMEENIFALVRHAFINIIGWCYVLYFLAN